MTTLKVDKVERMLMDKVCKMMRPLKEMIDVTSPNTVWVDPKWVGGQPSGGRSRPRKDFTLVKKRGIIPDGLVQRKLDLFKIVYFSAESGLVDKFEYHIIKCIQTPPQDILFFYSFML